MYLVGLFSMNAFHRGRSRSPSVATEDVASAVWSKSSLSSYNGSCVEIARLGNGLVGVRDTKDRGAGPILGFTQNEWSAFLGGVKAGEFDAILWGKGPGSVTLGAIANSRVVRCAL